MSGRSVLVMALVAVNVVVALSSRRALRERTELERRLGEMAKLASSNETAGRQRRRLEALVDVASTFELSRTRNIASFREALIGIESGLGVERLSLDFRPEEDLPAGLGGSRIHASLRGGFDDLREYLRRVESLGLALAPEELSLRGESSAGTVLSVRWLARWPLDATPSRFASRVMSEIPALTRWLSRKAPPSPRRNPFASRPEAVRSSPVVLEPDTTAKRAPSSEASGPPPRRSRPTLTGFVLARAELEPDVSRRVLAAVRLDDELHLVKLGDRLGDYRVVGIDARESLTLVDETTGERLELRLE